MSLTTAGIDCTVSPPLLGGCGCGAFCCVAGLQTRFTLQPSPGRYLETLRSSGGDTSLVRYAVYDIADIVSNRRVLNVDVKHEIEPQQAHITPSTLTAHRFQTGFYFKSILLL